MTFPSIDHGPTGTAGASGSQREEEKVHTLSHPTLRDTEASALYCNLRRVCPQGQPEETHAPHPNNKARKGVF